jgi:nucleotide-binding universal stress UspA family protein
VTAAQNVSNLSRILVATDLSPRALKAIARAVQLAAEQGAVLTILHVLTAETGNKARQRQVALQAEKDLRRDIATLSSARDGRATIRVVTGTPFVEIIRRAREEAADLILVGRMERNSLRTCWLVPPWKK